MKKLLFTFLGSLAIGAALAQNIAYWDFNSVPPDGATNTGTTTPKEGAGTITVVGGATSTYAAGYSLDPETPNSDNSGFNTSTYPTQGTGDKTRGIQFTVDLTGKDKIGVEFWQRLSNTAANTWTFQYCLDVTEASPVWIDFVTFDPVTAGDTWWFRQVDLTSVTGLNNNPNAGFRVVSTFDPVLVTQYKAANPSSTYSTSGTSRFDLVKVVSIVNYTVAFQKNHQLFNENSPSAAIVNALVIGKGNFTAKIDMQVTATSTAGMLDYTIAGSTVNINSFRNAGDTIPITVSVIDDGIKESDEYLVFRLDNASYVNYNANARHYLYIKDDDKDIPTAGNNISLNLLSSFSNGSGSAEISAYDKGSKRIFIANSVANRLDIVNFADPANPTLITSVNLGPDKINSVACYNGIVALAMENGTNPQDNGYVHFYDVDGNFLNSVEVGAMPDMVTFNHAGTKVYTADEGEPNDAYTLDPVGSVSVIDISGGIAGLTQAHVKQITFDKYIGQEAALRAAGVRIYGPGANAAQDFEPEYITISDNDSIAWVSLQENNALAKISLLGDSVISIMPLGYKDHSIPANSMDASNVTVNVYSSTFPVKGIYMPDALAHYTVGGNVYVLSANEGDSRAYTGFSEEVRVSAANLDATVFPDQVDLKNNNLLGRLSITNKLGDIDNDGDLDELYSYGARSFSIWDGETGAQVYDSGNEFELITENHPTFSNLFNSSHSFVPVKKDRSDDKGPEPEGVVTAKINGKDYAFISFERIGGVMAYDITNPASPKYVTYNNNRPADRGAEGLIYIEPQDSPNGQGILILSNEVSSTLSIYSVLPCSNPGIGAASGINTTFCEGDSAKLYATSPNSSYTYKWLKNNQPITGADDSVYYAHESGNYRLFAYDISGCVDTSIVINVTKLTNSFATLNQTACNQYLSPSGTYTWTTSGVYNDTIPNAAGCDSILTINLTVNYPSASTQTITACDSYTSPSGNYIWAVTGVYNDTIPNAGGCDSVITFNLIIKNSTISTQTLTVCDSYTSPSGNYVWAVSGVYNDTIPNAVGCDSIITFNLTVNNSSVANQTLTVCDSYTSPSGNYVWTVSGVYNDTIPNVAGCDSIITYNLTVNNSTVSSQTLTVCDSYTSPSGNYVWAVSGVYNDTIPNVAGCDSIITFNLTVKNSTVSSQTLTVCDNYTSPSGNYVWAVSGVYNDTIPNSAGCDSVITFSLTVNHSNATTDVVTACDSYTWIDDNTYTSNNNTATYTLQNINGCDSVITLNLIINHSDATTDVVTACDSYTWIDGNTYTSNNNTATYTLQNINGCDSVITLNLTINHSDATTDVVAACDSYTWIDGNTYNSSNNTATFTLQNINGCDSVITLNLTINHSDASTDVIAACDSYTWIDGNTYTSDNNTATYTLQNINGCDSVITLNLTINHSDATTDVVAACDSYTWIDGNTYNSSNNTATFTLQNINGCDSLITLDLTIYESENITFNLQPNICSDANQLTLSATPAGGTFSGLGVTGNTFDPSSVTPGSTVTISYEYVNSQGCTTVVSQDITVDICTGTKLNAIAKVTVAPNPANDKITITTTNHNPQSLEITNAIGQVVYQSVLNGVQTVDISAFTPGIYLVKVDNTLVKVVKQ